MKMYVPDRTPAAHRVAARQNKTFTGCHVYVEGGSDCKFWKNHLVSKNVQIRACKGWKNVVTAVINGCEDGALCIGIIDKDFRELLEYEDMLSDNIFLTDDHDLEMMLLKTSAARRVINSYDSSDHIDKFEHSNGNIIQFAVGITDKIGCIKLAAMKNKLKILFKIFKEDGTFKMPNYEKCMTPNNYLIRSDLQLVNYVIDWSKSHGERLTLSNDEIFSSMQQEQNARHNSWQLSNGHDVCYILSYILSKLIPKTKKDSERFEDLLRTAVSKEELYNSQLFHHLRKWEDSNIKILM